MFGHTAEPSRIWSFSANAPIEEGLDAVRVREQMRLAHRYRNQLVEIELARRAAVDAALAKLAPGLARVEADLATATAALDAARAAKKQTHSRERKRARDPAAEAAIKVLREQRKALYARRKEIREGLFGVSAKKAKKAGTTSRPPTPEWVVRQAEIDAADLAARKAARAESGLYWGSYLHVEQSLSDCRSGAPPKFLRWDGHGHLAVQLQGGLDMAEALAGQDTRLRVELRPGGVWVPGHKRFPPGVSPPAGLRVQPHPDGGSVALRKLGDALVRFRVGSEPSGAPVWAVVPIRLHRLPPADARVKWAHLLVRRVGPHEEWRVQLVLARTDGWTPPDAAKTGTVGVDIGWRRFEGEGLRVAYWVGNDGREGEERLPERWLAAMRKVEDLQSIRDKLFTEARDALAAAWLRATPGPAPPLREAAETLAQWRSQGRLAALVLRWRDAREPGDTEAFKAAEAWRKRDKHLWCYQAHLREQLQHERLDRYRCLAARLRRTYATAVIEGRSLEEIEPERPMDLRTFHEIPPAEAPLEAPGQKDSPAKRHVRDACLSTLRRCLQESMTVVTTPATNTTRRCHACRAVEEFDHTSLVHTCGGCGRSWDQDANAAWNLLSSATAVTVGA